MTDEMDKLPPAGKKPDGAKPDERAPDERAPEESRADDKPDENRLIAERREKLNALRAQGVAFPNDFKLDASRVILQPESPQADAETIDAAARRVKVAGRMVLKRGQGKVSFVQLQDISGRIQLFIQANALGDTYESFKSWDIGDIVRPKAR